MEQIQILGALVVYLGACELAEYLLVRNLGDEVFAPKLSARLLRWAVLGGSIGEIIYVLHEKPPGQDRKPRRRPSETWSLQPQTGRIPDGAQTPFAA